MGRSVAECLALAWGHGGQGTDSRLRFRKFGAFRVLPSAVLPLHKATSNSLKKSGSKQDTTKAEENMRVAAAASVIVFVCLFYEMFQLQQAAERRQMLSGHREIKLLNVSPDVRCLTCTMPSRHA